MGSARRPRLAMCGVSCSTVCAEWTYAKAGSLGRVQWYRSVVTNQLNCICGRNSLKRRFKLAAAAMLPALPARATGVCR